MLYTPEEIKAMSAEMIIQAIAKLDHDYGLDLPLSQVPGDHDLIANTLIALEDQLTELHVEIPKPPKEVKEVKALIEQVEFGVSGRKKIKEAKKAGRPFLPPRKLHTPKGVFHSLQDASRELNITTQSLRNYLSQRKHMYYYLD